MPDPGDEEEDLETVAGSSDSGASRPGPGRGEETHADVPAETPLDEEDEGATIASVPAPPKPAQPPAPRRAADAEDEPPTGEIGEELESLPPRPRVRPAGPPAAPPAPPSVPRREPEPDDEGATLASAAAVPQSEFPTGEIPRTELPVARDVGTVAGGFASGATRASGAGDDEDDKATIADAGAASAESVRVRPTPTTGPRGATPGPTVPDAGGGSRTARSQGPVPASKWSRGTARDPIAGTAAGRGTVPGARPGPAILAEGQLLADRYELIRRLGKGGMGEVWQAKHTLLQGMRAIKVIKASISRDPEFRARFLREGQTMMRVKHPGVVEVTDLDETRLNRELFMVMEYLQGRTLHDAVRDPKTPLRLDVRDCVRIFRELALGMQRIHDERIVHKDLKTDNVVLVKLEDGLEHPKVIDFGLAKRIDEGHDVPTEKAVAAVSGHGDTDVRTTLSGTLAYMSPEQFRGEPSSFQSDLYAFGVMLYECFMEGEYPMPRGSLAEYARRHKAGEVPKRLRQARPDLDAAIADLADRCMAPRREDRPESFAKVAADMKWWLGAPERARRRKQIAGYASAATVLVAVAVYGFFFKKQPAGVANVVLRPAGGGELVARGDRTFVPGTALAGLAFEGAVTGEAGTPSLLVDGSERPAELRIESRDGRRFLVGVADLSALADGEHVLGFRASSGAEPTPLRVVVDRRPPQVRAVSVRGGRDRFTNAENPQLSIEVDAPHDELQGVAVRTGTGGAPRSADRDPDDPRRWTVSGVAEGDGETVVLVTATDLAGNRTGTPFEFRFTRDVVRPVLDVDGFVGDGVQVREPAGNVLVVRSTEDVSLRAEFRRAGDAVPVARDLGTAREFRIDVPDVAGGALDVSLVATDRAGNENDPGRRTRAFPLRVVADEAAITTADGAPRTAVRATDDVVLRLQRTYPLPAEFSVTRSRLRGRDGTRAGDESAVPLQGVRVVPDPAKPDQAEVRLPANLPAGEYGLSVQGLEGASTRAFTLVVDPDPPAIEAVAVRDAEGRDVPPDGWCLTEEAVVVATVSDLSPDAVTLDGAAPAERPEPGRRTYTFRTRLARQGANSLTLAVRDRSGNDATRPVVVRGDWTNPVLTLVSPRAGDALDDVTPVTFGGACSEEQFRLVVSGLPGAERTSDHTQRDFAVQWRLPEGEHTVAVTAVDPAGRRSAPLLVALRVEHRALILPDLVRWHRAPAVDMRKVVAGDVVIDGRTQPVAEVFLDLTEVTNRQYREFLAACEAHRGGKTPWDHPEQPAGWTHVPPAETWNDKAWNADDLPVVNVAWWDAWAFAKWSGRRLPTEAEWVKAAAKAAGELELRSWPPVASGAPWKDGLLATAESTGQKGPVDATKTSDVSPAGCLHMGGNVSEWVDVPFAREGEPRTGVRGGSFWTTRFGADVRRVPTKPYDRSTRARTIGFRCAVDAGEVSP